MRAPAKLPVLVVDDYPDAGASLALLLRCWGYEAHVARTADEAVAASRQYRPRVAVVEGRLRGGEGFALARRLGAEPDGPALVALTGQGDERSRRQAHESGFVRFFVKPGDPEQLRALLDQYQQAP
jgi:DNA-binding response OmpR family regulator